MTTCCHPECDAKLPSFHVCCAYHWRGVNSETRRAVQTRLHGWRNPDAAREYLYQFFMRQLKKG